ncbi:magnesium/cobalt transporter CorA [Candidatus Nitrospira bockiana]
MKDRETGRPASARGRRRSAKAGLPPGTLIYIGERGAERVRLTMLRYAEDLFEEQEVKSVEDFLSVCRTSPPGTVTWLDVGGIHDVGVVEALGQGFQLHPLLLEDIVNTEQRPKREDYGGYLYVVVKMLSTDASRTRIQAEQVSLVVVGTVLLSFQENGTDVFAPIRERLRTGKGRARSFGVDYLLYSLIDAIVDNYFAVLEVLGERIEGVEDALLEAPTPHSIRDLYALRRELLFVRRAVWPLREVLSGLERGDAGVITPATRLYLRDVYDHSVQVIDTLETLRETVAEMLDVYLSSVSNRMTGVMKVLTIITTIFMPLSFLAGLYGMNFPWMPGLHEPWGYPLVLGSMFLVALLMILVFRKKRWL